MAKSQPLPQAVSQFTAMLRHFAPEVASQKWRAARALGILLAGVALQLIEPWPLKYVIDAIASAAVGGPQPSLPFGLKVQSLLLASAGAYILVVALRSLAEYYEAIAFAQIGNRVVSRIRTKLYRHLQALPLAFHNKSRHGDLLIRMVGDVKLLRDVAVTAVLPLLGGMLVLVGMLGVMLWLNWQLAVVALLALPVFALATLRTGRKIRAAAQKQRQRESQVAALAAEAISSMQVVKALSLESTFEEGFSSGDDQCAREEVKSRRLAAKLTLTTDLLIATATAVVLWYGGKQALSGQLSPGELVVFMTYFKRGLRPLQDLAKFAARLAKATAAGDRIVELLDILADGSDKPNAPEAPRFKGAIEFDHVDFAYDPAAPILKNFSVRIAPGEFVALVGGSGSGKSTVLNLLSRFYEPTRGQVLVDGADLTQYAIASVRGQLCTVLQDTVLFAANVWDNIALGALGASREQIEAAARIAGAHEFLRELPEGYDTLLGERGVNLSHGQRQRIAIARAVVRDAPIVLLDEPATALDGRNRRLVRDGLLKLVEGRTAVLVTHDLSEARLADRILVLDNGRIVEKGTHAELIALAGLYAQMVHSHAPQTLAEH
jgi:ATP-binding cassette, subfamily B, bacterial